MANPPPTVGSTMTEDEIRTVLRREHHGVLSMGADDRGYGFPIVYWYEDGAEAVVFGFTVVPDSKKLAFANSTEEVTLTIYDFEDVDDWASVIVTGTIHEVEDADVPEEFSTMFFFRENEATGDRKTHNFDQYERAWYELRMDDLSGRHSGPKSKLS